MIKKAIITMTKPQFTLLILCILLGLDAMSMSVVDLLKAIYDNPCKIAITISGKKVANKLTTELSMTWANRSLGAQI